jgi:hypothetical protein
MAKAEPNLVEVNREPDPNTVSRMMDAERALAVLRSENDRLKANARIAAQNDETHKKNAEYRQKEILRLQAELLEHVPSGLNREDSPGAVYEGFYRH